MARTPAQEFMRGINAESSDLDDQLASTVGGIMNQLPSLLMNYSLKEDALAKSIATKSAENILLKSSKFTDSKQYEDSISYVENLFAEHGDDLTMTAVRNNALEALNENMFNFNENESATIKLNSLLSDERTARTALDTDAYREVINDFTSIFNAKKNFLSKQAINSYSEKQDDMLSWLDHAILTMSWDDDLESPGLQTADKNIEMSGHALKLNDLKAAFKYLGEAGKGIAAGSEHAAYAAAVPQLITIGKQHNASVDKLTNQKYAKWVYKFPIPSQANASDSKAMKMMGQQVEVQLSNILKDTTVKELKDDEGIPLASDSNKSILGIIQYLEDQGVWMDMNAAVPMLDQVLNFKGTGKDVERHEAINFYFGLQMYDQYYQTGAIANMAAANAGQSFAGDLQEFATTAATVSDSVNTNFNEIEDVSNLVPVGNDEFGTPIYQRRDTWDMDQIDKVNQNKAVQDSLKQQHLDALVALDSLASTSTPTTIPIDPGNVGFDRRQAHQSAEGLLGLDTDSYREDLVLDSTGKTLGANIIERLQARTGDTLSDILVNQSLDDNETSMIIEELFNNSMKYFGQEFESIEAMLAEIMNQ
jgi:hypothetical protein